MRFYQLTYTVKRPAYGVLGLWPEARQFFKLDENFQYSSEEIKKYVTEYVNTQYPPVSEWFGSERDAVVRRLKLFNDGMLEGKKGDHVIWPVDIPTDKQGLLAWLKENAT